MAWVRKGGQMLTASNSYVGSIKLLCKVDTKSLMPIQAASMYGKALQDNLTPKLKPYPYKTKKFGMHHGWIDRTTHHFNENSKIIVVEGPIAAGKNAFAQELADDFGMAYMPACNIDEIYINPYGYDMRQLDHALPPKCRSYDFSNYCLTPEDTRVANFQIQMYRLRYAQYIEACGHVLSTGQGVVLNRCVYSDFVFLEAMVKCGYISKAVQSLYYDLKQNTIMEVLKPHLVIYLDISVKTVQDRIKKRNICHELDGLKNGLNPKFLESMEVIYKQKYLKEISNHAELLVYDWSDYGEVEVVVEDIERIDFDKYGKHDSKLEDWRIDDEWDWAALRKLLTTHKVHLMNYFNIPRYDIDELIVDGYEAKQRRDVWESAPGMRYMHGFNKDQGDTGLLLKRKFTNYKENI